MGKRAKMATMTTLPRGSNPNQMMKSGAMVIRGIICAPAISG